MGTFNSPSHRLPLLNQQTTDQNYGNPTTRLALNNGPQLPLVLGSRESQATGRSVTKALKQAERNSASSVQCDRQGSRESLSIGRSVTNQSRQRGIQRPVFNVTGRDLGRASVLVGQSPTKAGREEFSIQCHRVHFITTVFCVKAEFNIKSWEM